MVSRTAEYALRAAVCLARRAPAAMTAERVSGETRVPASYLSKVLRMLARAGLVRSIRGAHGGYVLAAPPGEISILKIVNAIEPLRRIEECPAGLAWHEAGLCPLHRELDAAVARAEASFSSTTLAALVAAGGMCGADE